MEESLCTCGMHCSSTYQAFEWMYVVCLPVPRNGCPDSKTVSVILGSIKVVKLSRMLLKRWHVRLRPSSNINSRGAPIIGSAIGNAQYRPNFRLSDSDQIA